MPTASMERPRVVCICGSMRFYERMLRVASDFTLDGTIVVMPFVLKDDAHDQDVKAKLDVLHFAKIDLADDVFIVDVDEPEDTPYIGESTTREVRYARMRHRPVDSLSGERYV